ncbi:amino acid ABC transporter permease [Thalassococcus lentus]|uniref:Amino acid ABC transporter permease n=1 Tax=Thalassococcus lentus TaxID=1210524 RepID=A0ABT4XXP2_9RHOB|nr:amino acid ABC transporter permease [Thalassococcus lentus]MDA7426731.1 amino acid ABC transporter permease [Thalassococcus lentus]
MTQTLTRRQAFEARQRRRATTLAVGSTVAVLVALVVLIPLAPGWEAVKRSFFNAEVFAKTFPGLLNAFVLDVAIFAWCAPLIALLGLAVALMRDIRNPALYPLRLLAILYTDVFRGLPVILVIYLIGFGIPGLGLPRPWNSPYIWGSLALILVYAAYVAEVIRSGIESVHQSQRSAALSLGLSPSDAMRFVVLPQAIRRVVPANMNLFIALQKDVALLSFIGPVEIFRQAGVYKSLMANFTPYVGAAIIFLCLTIPATRYADYLMNRQRKARS